MQRIGFSFLSIEGTRRCNLRCSHCMRGECQDIDITKECIDILFNTCSKGFEIISIQDLCFTGGEPTLNPEIIIYTIDKIIRENINVVNLSMVTNGQIFVPELVEAFNRFNEYRNQRVFAEIEKEFVGYEYMQRVLKKENTDNHVSIAFSVDRFHKHIKDEIKEMYKSSSKGLVLGDKDLKDSEVLKSGLSTFGQEFVGKIFHCIGEEKSGYIITTNVYITANGGIIYGGDGSFEYMDANLVGDIKTYSLLEEVRKHSDNNILIQKRSLL